MYWTNSMLFLIYSFHFVKHFKASFSIVLISVLCETFPKEMQHKHLFTQDREPAPILSNECIEVQHGELMNWLRLFTGI